MSTDGRTDREIPRQVEQTTHPQSVAFDPLNQDHADQGTFGDGLWKSDDGMLTWNRIGKDEISSRCYVTAWKHACMLELSQAHFIDLVNWLAC